MIGNLWFHMYPRHRRLMTSQHHCIRPMLERLEDRITPSTVMESAADAAQLQTELNNATAASTQYVINLTGPDSAYTLASGQQLTVSSGGSSISIIGTGQSLTGNGNRVFDVLTGANLILQNLTITDGSGVAQGAGLYDAGGKVMMSNVNVMGNTALGSSSAVNAQGGGIYISGSGATLTLDNVRISGNKAMGGTGAAGVNAGHGGNGGNAQGGGIYVSGGATVDISGAAVTDNIAYGGNGGNGSNRAGAGGDGGPANGGGAYLSTSATATSTILNSSFTGNQAAGGKGGDGGTFTDFNGLRGGGGGGGGNAGMGGGLFLGSGSVQILNTTVADNRAYGGGSGLGAGGTAGGIGGGIAIGTAADATLMNNTIYHNDTSGNPNFGGGVFSSASTNPTLVNNLLLDNLDDAPYAFADTNLTLVAGDDNLTTADTKGQAILGPQQTTANGLVYYPLLPGSNAAIDQGNNSALATIAAAEGVAPTKATDEIGGTRLVNGVIDIGAIEFPPTSTGGGSPSGGNTTNPPSMLDAAFTIALDAAELVLEINGITSVGPFVFQPPMALLQQILANLPYAGTLDSMVLQLGAQAGQQLVAQHGGSNH